MHLIIQMGAFSYNVHKWNDLDNAKKTFPSIITHFTNVKISQCQLVGMQYPHLQNIHQLADKLSNQAESIAAMA